MHSLHRVALGLAAASLLSLSGCSKNEAEALARVKAEVAKKDAVAARIELKNLLQKHPKSGEARYLLGARLLDDGEAAAAVIELERALEYQYAQDLVLPTLAEALIQSGQAARVPAQYASTQLREAAAQARLQAAVAKALAMQGDSAGAQTAVDRALAAAPTAAPALLMKAKLAAMAGDLAGALATLDPLLAAQPQNDEAWALKGDLLLRQPEGRKPAMEAFAKALQAKPSQIYSQSALITLHLAQGDLPAAQKQFAALKKLAPRQGNTVFLEANLAYAAGNHARAREVFQSLLRVMPDNVNLLLSSGENELKLNAVLQAETQFAKAAALAPRNAMARRLLAQAQMRLGQAPKALVTLAPLVDAPDASADVLALAAQARLLNGEAKAADALYTRLAKLKPSDPRLRTIVASAGFGKADDSVVFNELRAIATEDSTGTSADLAIVSALLRRGQSDAALQALAAMERKRSGDPLVHQMRGQLLASKNDSVGARASFEAALKINPTYFPSVAALAALDLRDAKPDAAKQRFNDLLKLQPNNAQALLGLAELLSRQGAPRAEVLRQIEAATKAAPTDGDARIALIAYHFSGNNFDAALSAAQAATVALPESIELLELLGRCQLRVKQTSQALSTYGKIITLQPKSPRGHVAMADVYLASNDLDQAQRSVNRALELSPGLPEAQAQAIVLALRKNQPEAAVAISRQVQAARPTEAMGFLLEGDIEMKRGHWDAATAVLRKAVDKAAPGAAAMKLYQSMTRAGKAGEAEAFAAQWLKAHAQDSNFLFLLGDTAQSRGDAAMAEKRYTQVLALVPEHVLALNNLAMLQVQQKRPGAVALAERAVKAAPQQPAMLDTLAQALASEDQPGKAVATQKLAVALAPDLPELRLNLAKLLLQAGEKAQARAELDRLAKLGNRFARQDEVARMSQALNAQTLSR